MGGKIREAVGGGAVSGESKVEKGDNYRGSRGGTAEVLRPGWVQELEAGVWCLVLDILSNHSSTCRLGG